MPVFLGCLRPSGGPPVVRKFLENLGSLRLGEAFRERKGEVRAGQGPVLRQAKASRAIGFLDGIGGKGVIRGCGGKKGDGGKGNRFRVVTSIARYSLVTVTLL